MPQKLAFRMKLIPGFEEEASLDNNLLDRETLGLLNSKGWDNMPTYVPLINDTMPIARFRDDRNYTLLIRDLRKTHIDPNTETEKSKAR